MDSDVKIALLEQQVDSQEAQIQVLRDELAVLKGDLSDMGKSITTGKGIAIGVLFVLGAGGIALSQGIKNWLGVG